MITELITRQGFPHWLQKTKDTIDLVHDKPVNVGDGFTFYQNLETIDKSQMPVYRVTEILETRPSKGDHQFNQARGFIKKHGRLKKRNL